MSIKKLSFEKVYTNNISRKRFVKFLTFGKVAKNLLILKRKHSSIDMRLFSLLYPLDLFKRPLFLKIKRHEMIATRLGVILSITIYAVLAVFFSQSDFFQKLQPQIFSTTTPLDAAPTIEYKDFPFAFAVKDVSGNIYYDPRVFSFEIMNVNRTFETNKSQSLLNSTEYTFHPCNSSDYTDPNEFSVLEGLFCLDNNNFILSGGENEQTEFSFHFNIVYCQNSTSNGNFCRSSSDIEAFFQMKNLMLVYKTLWLQPQDYLSPFRTKFSATLYKLDSTLNRLVSINFQKVIMNSEETVILTNTLTYESFSYEIEKSEYGLISSSENIVFTALFFSSSNCVIIKRTYQSLTQALAVLGGLFSFLTICGRLLLFIDHSLYVTTLVMNFLYSFQQPSQIEQIKEVSLMKRASNIFQSSRQKEKINKENLERSKKRREKSEEPLEFPSFNKKKEKQESEENYLKSQDFPLEIELESPLPINKNVTKATTVDMDSWKKNKLKLANRINNPMLENIRKDPLLIHFSEENIQASRIMKRNSDPPLSNPKEQQIIIPEIRPRNDSTIIRMLKRVPLFRKDHKTPQNLDDFLKFKDQENKIKFNILSYFKLFVKKLFGRNTNLNEKLFERAQQVFENEIDIVRILQMIQDIEKLKQLLLSPKQLALFDVLDKPMIFVEENSQEKGEPVLKINLRKKSMKTQMNQAIDYYQELEHQDVSDPLDKKLFTMVGNRIKAFKQYFQNK